MTRSESEVAPELREIERRLDLRESLWRARKDPEAIKCVIDAMGSTFFTVARESQELALAVVYAVRLAERDVDSAARIWFETGGIARLENGLRDLHHATGRLIRVATAGQGLERQRWIESPAPDLNEWELAVLRAVPASDHAFEEPRAIAGRVARNPPSSAQSVRELVTKHRKRLIELHLVERDPASTPRHGRYRRTPAGDDALSKIQRNRERRFH